MIIVESMFRDTVYLYYTVVFPLVEVYYVAYILIVPF